MEDTLPLSKLAFNDEGAGWRKMIRKLIIYQNATKNFSLKTEKIGKESLRFKLNVLNFEYRDLYEDMLVGNEHIQYVPHSNF